VTDGARTRDIEDHNLALYQLSYGHQLIGGTILFALARLIKARPTRQQA
jgi:hypothetical protein